MSDKGKKKKKSEPSILGAVASALDFSSTYPVKPETVTPSGRRSPQRGITLLEYAAGADSKITWGSSSASSSWRRASIAPEFHPPRGRNEEARAKREGNLWEDGRDTETENRRGSDRERIKSKKEEDEEKIGTDDALLEPTLFSDSTRKLSSEASTITETDVKHPKSRQGGTFHYNDTGSESFVSAMDEVRHAASGWHPEENETRPVRPPTWSDLNRGAYRNAPPGFLDIRSHFSEGATPGDQHHEAGRRRRPPAEITVESIHSSDEDHDNDKHVGEERRHSHRISHHFPIHQDGSGDLKSGFYPAPSHSPSRSRGRSRSSVAARPRSVHRSASRRRHSISSQPGHYSPNEEGEYPKRDDFDAISDPERHTSAHGSARFEEDNGSVHNSARTRSQSRPPSQISHHGPNSNRDEHNDTGRWSDAQQASQSRHSKFSFVNDQAPLKPASAPPFDAGTHSSAVSDGRQPSVLSKISSHSRWLNESQQGAENLPQFILVPRILTIGVPALLSPRRLIVRRPLKNVITVNPQGRMLRLTLFLQAKPIPKSGLTPPSYATHPPSSPSHGAQRFGHEMHQGEGGLGWSDRKNEDCYGSPAMKAPSNQSFGSSATSLAGYPRSLLRPQDDDPHEPRTPSSRDRSRTRSNVSSSVEGRSRRHYDPEIDKDSDSGAGTITPTQGRIRIGSQRKGWPPSSGGENDTGYATGTQGMCSTRSQSSRRGSHVGPLLARSQAGPPTSEAEQTDDEVAELSQVPSELSESESESQAKGQIDLGGELAIVKRVLETRRY
ncbi:hypothetical protein T439DRAFT_383208 [Meredithblackwellia eburnea MCA 4105]